MEKKTSNETNELNASDLPYFVNVDDGKVMKNFRRDNREGEDFEEVYAAFLNNENIWIVENIKDTHKLIIMDKETKTRLYTVEFNTTYDLLDVVRLLGFDGNSYASDDDQMEKKINNETTYSDLIEGATGLLEWVISFEKDRDFPIRLSTLDPDDCIPKFSGEDVKLIPSIDNWSNLHFKTIDGVVTFIEKCNIDRKLVTVPLEYVDKLQFPEYQNDASDDKPIEKKSNNRTNDVND